MAFQRLLLALNRLMRTMSKSAFITGLVGGSVWVLERRRRQSAERLAAAALETLLNAIEANDHQTGQHDRSTSGHEGKEGRHAETSS